jgi:hypothetical protein
MRIRAVVTVLSGAEAVKRCFGPRATAAAGRAELEHHTILIGAPLRRRSVEVARGIEDYTCIRIRAVNGVAVVERVHYILSPRTATAAGRTEFEDDAAERLA